MAKRALWFSILFFSSFADGADPQAVAKRIHAHLIIHDYSSALEEAQEALQQTPEALPLWEGYIQALALAGQEKEMMQAWRRYEKLNPDAYENREILEAMAWGTIQQGARSSLPLVRVMAMLAAFFGNDHKGIDIIVANLRDSNKLIRSVALEVASQLNDAPLCDAVLEMLKNETSWHVRLAAIQAVGAMGIKKARPELLKIVGSSESAPEEIGVAVEALVRLMDHPRLVEITKLAQSERAGLRLLACELAAEFEMEEALPVLLPLLDDTHYEVRNAALLAIGMVNLSEVNEVLLAAARRHLQDPEDRVAIAAAWLLTRYHKEEGQRAFEPLLKSSVRETRLLAAAALASCGELAMPLILQAFHLSTDPYVRLNLAKGLIGQRIDTEAARDALYESFANSNERWMPLEFGIFSAIAPSKVKHDDSSINKPETINQKVRLEILNLLAITNHPKASDGLKKLLKEKTWGVSAVASIQLLSEGDEEAVDLVSSLLQDLDPTVRVQAALVLAIWGRGEEAVPVLQSSYAQSDRETKERILEGLGHVGTPASIPFLLDRMEESSQTLRLMAAAGIIQVLYN